MNLHACTITSKRFHRRPNKGPNTVRPRNLIRIWAVADVVKEAATNLQVEEDQSITSTRRVEELNIHHFTIGKLEVSLAASRC